MAGQWSLLEQAPRPADVSRHFCYCAKGRVDAHVQISPTTWPVAAWFATGIAAAILPSGCVSQARTAPVLSLSEHCPWPEVPPPAFPLLGLHEVFSNVPLSFLRLFKIYFLRREELQLRRYCLMLHIANLTVIEILS